MNMNKQAFAWKEQRSVPWNTADTFRKIFAYKLKKLKVKSDFFFKFWKKNFLF